MADEYIIVGDTDKYTECLVATCGKSEEWANEVLQRMLTNPTENDKRLMERHHNFKVKKIAGEDCWWNDPFLAN